MILVANQEKVKQPTHRDFKITIFSLVTTTIEKLLLLIIMINILKYYIIIISTTTTTLLNCCCSLFAEFAHNQPTTLKCKKSLCLLLDYTFISKPNYKILVSFNIYINNIHIHILLTNYHQLVTLYTICI